MDSINLKPYMREGLDILFVGLNPAKGSNNNHHYFSVNQAFWNQLYDSGLILERVIKICGDVEIFRKNSKNYNNWSYGITDLITDVAESDSSKVTVTDDHCKQLISTIKRYKPTIVILLHSKINQYLFRYLGRRIPKSNEGQIGQSIGGCSSMFYTIAFPHGNNITSQEKINKYREVKEYIKEYQSIKPKLKSTRSLIINGSPRKKGDTMTLIKELVNHLDGETKVVNTYYDNISPCMDCRYCWKQDACPIDDDMQEIYQLLNEVDNVIIASPIYFSELTGKMLSFASRLQRFFVQRVIRKVEGYYLKQKKGAIILVGGGDGSSDPAEERARIIFHQMNAKSVGTVRSLCTNNKPASHDEEALSGVRDIAAKLNTSYSEN